MTGLCKKDYKKRLGYKIPKTRAPEAPRQKRAAVDLPASLDYRTTSPPLVTAVKSQGKFSIKKIKSESKFYDF